MVVNTKREGVLTPPLARLSWKLPPCTGRKHAELKEVTKDLRSCNADLKSKIRKRARHCMGLCGPWNSAELGEPVRNGRVLLGAQRSRTRSEPTCRSVTNEDFLLLRDCNAELDLHFENAEIEAEIEPLKRKINCLYHYSHDIIMDPYDIERCMDDDPANDYARQYTDGSLVRSDVAKAKRALRGTLLDSTWKSPRLPDLYLPIGELGPPSYESSKTPECRRHHRAIKRLLSSCNSHIASLQSAELGEPVRNASLQSAELGEPVRNGRVLLGSSDDCARVMIKEKYLLAECKAELAVHSKNAALKAELKKRKRDVSCAHKFQTSGYNKWNAKEVIRVIRTRYRC